MSAFIGQLNLRALPEPEVRAAGGTAQLYDLIAELGYTSDLLGVTLTIPVGLRTDFASIPRLAWQYLDPEDPAILYPSVVHDYLYHYAGDLPNFPGRVFTRLEADQVLHEAMGLCGARWDQKTVVFGAVRAAGWLHWATPKGVVNALPSR